MLSLDLVFLYCFLFIITYVRHTITAFPPHILLSNPLLKTLKVVHSCNSSTHEVEEIKGQLGLLSKILSPKQKINIR